MVKILTEEWVKAFGDAINENPNYKPSALTWEGDVLLVIEPSGNLDHEVRVFIGLFHGECTETRLVREGEEVETEYIMAGPYVNFVKIMKKEIDPIRAIMAGQIRLEGNMAILMRHTKAAQELVESLGRFETEYL
ncbi:MAG: SCP2 sterol-binding domain-containing protein [Promethearchaeota archaeon]